jgi:uncharacterized Zn-binding protein involved in type VI secretion
MSQPAATQGNLAAHGTGTILMGSTNVFIGGRPAARVGDPVVCTLHGAGSITRGSATVLINGMPAARMGDMTGCMMPGLAAISVPAVLGPPPTPAPPPGAVPLGGAVTFDKTRSGKTHAQNDEAKGGVSALHAEGFITDANADGNYDTIEGSAEMIRLRQKGYTDAGPVELSGTNNMDLFYGSAKYSVPSFTGANQAAYGSAEAGMMKWAVSGGVGAPGAKGLNSQSIGAEVNMFHAKAEGDWLAGDDGNRVGVVAKGEAGAEVLKGEAITVITSPSIGGYNAQFTQKGGAAAGTVGGGAGFWGYFDKKQSRFHVGAMAKLKLLFGLEGEWNVSIGKVFEEDPPASPPAAPAASTAPAASLLFSGYLNTPGMGMGGLPGTILLGNFQVLIGG